MGLLSKLFSARPNRLSRAPRRVGVEPLEQRRLLAADVLFGAVYLEDALSGSDDSGDVIQVSFVGGAEGTTLDRVVIDGDKSGDGPSVADVFFDIEDGGAGAFDAVGLEILESDGFTIESVEVLDGGTSIAFNLSGFEAGEELIFSIDVDEYGESRGALNSNAFAEGGEFEGSSLTGDFSAVGYVDLTMTGEFFDSFDGDFAIAESAAQNELTRLPGDDYDDPNDPEVPVRTAGAVAHAPQVELASVSGYVYHDQDDDGLRDPGEDPIDGVTVELLDESGAVIATTTTNALGYYEFIHLDAGTYGVRETQPDGWYDGKDTEGTANGVVANDLITSIVLDWGVHATEYNFGELLGGSISGQVGAEHDGDCDFDDPDILIEGVVIELLDAQGIVIATTTTDANGRYRFDDLKPGTYSVRETQPEGWYDGGEQVGTAGGVAADDLISGIVIGSDEHATDYDFCEKLGASLSGYVYHDRSNDGLRDDGEEPIAGVTLKLLLADGTDTGQRAVTDENGYYEFTNLDAGTYTVMEDQPNGWLDGLDTPGSTGGEADNPGDMIAQITLEYAENATDYNFGELLPGTISGRVGASTDGECDYENPDLLLEGVVIELLDASGAVLATTTTDSNGEYRFENLAPGEYSVRELQPEGYYDGGERVGSAGGDASDDLISAISLGSEEDAINYDFCEHVGATLSGYVYHDVNDNGLFEEGEDPIAGVTLELLDANGVGTGVFTTTDSSGYYEFTNLAAGFWGVQETQPTGWFDGLDTAGSHGGSAGDDIITLVELDHGDLATDYNFGELLAGSISGRVHANNDDDCEFDEDDTPLEGVVIELLDPSGAVIQTTTTDAAGYYTFDGLRPGVYQVREIQPEGYYDGSEKVGAAGGVATDDLVSSIMLGSEQHATGYDFCEHLGADISGYVYHDADNDGIRDPGEDPIPGVTLKLLLQDGTDTGLRAVTDSSGYYEFTNLHAGKYRVMQIHPDGWIDGKDTPGSKGGVADNPGDMIREIMISYGDDAREYNFGELLPGSIAGAVFSAPDGECFDHDTAAPIAGVTIELLDETGAVVATTTTDANGEYLFDDLAPGKYTVREIQPDSHFDGGEQVGSGGGVAANDLLSEIVVGSDQHLTDYDFCEIPPATLSGYVFIDGAPIFSIDNTPPEDIYDVSDGLRTADDTPLAGVTVMLVNGTTGLPLVPGVDSPEIDPPSGYAFVEVLPGTYGVGVITTVTDENGYYEFTNLPSGSYGVVQVQPEGLIDGLDTAGTTGGGAVNPPVDGGPIPIYPLAINYGPDLLYSISLSAGQHSQENNFSEIDIFSGWIPPGTPDPEPPVAPPAPLAPAVIDPFYLLPPAPERPDPSPIGGSEDVYGYTWHLSVINAGAPRELGPQQEEVQFASQSDDPAWEGAERDADELRRAKWLLLAEGEDGAALEDLLFGVEDATPVSGDWNGDGVTDIGVYVDGDWYLDLDGDGRWGPGDLWAHLGTRDDLPVTGDWDGDGKTDIGIYGPAWPRDPHAIQRDPGMPDVANWPGPIAGKAKNVPPTEEDATSGGRLLAKLRAQIAAGRRVDRIDHVFHYGTPGDAPVVGDWNGDGIRTIGVFSAGEWTLDTNGDGRADEHDRQVALGQPGDRPIVGDFDGDGVDDLGVYREGLWLVDADHDGQLEQLHQSATNEAMAGAPVVGDWDGDGRDEPALYQAADQAPEVRVSQRDAG